MSSAIDVLKRRDNAREPLLDSVAVEEPLEIRLTCSTPSGRATKSLSITMRTPGNDDELAAGFLVSESIVRSADDIVAIEACGPPAPDTGNHNVVRVDLAASVEVDFGRLQRHFYSTSSCGVCGKASLDALHAEDVGVLADELAFDESVLIGMPAKLRDEQRTFDDTGGLHAAGAFSADGRLLVVREDVGRHNAVDKLVGQLLLDGRLPANDLGLIVSGRASFELVQKALVAGMPLLAAVSAPSSLAVTLAREFNMTLVGFLRGDSFNIYAGEQRVSA